MFHLVFAEAALELIPRELSKHPKVKAYAKRRGKPAEKIILDASKFHYLMKNITSFNKRGRPDIIHYCLLYALGSELNKSGNLRVYVHTLNDEVIFVNPEVRLPRNYSRFIGLIEKLFDEKKVTDSNGEELLSMQKIGLEALLKRIKPKITMLLRENRRLLTIDELTKMTKQNSEILFIIGAFPHGDFTNFTLQLANVEYSISTYELDAWNAAGKLICQLENITQKTEKI